MPMKPIRTFLLLDFFVFAVDKVSLSNFFNCTMNPEMEIPLLGAYEKRPNLKIRWIKQVRHDLKLSSLYREMVKDESGLFLLSTT